MTTRAGAAILASGRPVSTSLLDAHVEGAGKGLVERIGKLCEWKEPRAPEVRFLFNDVRAAPAVLTFLWDTRVGRIVPQALRRRPALGAALSFVFPWCDFLFLVGTISLFSCFLPLSFPWLVLFGAQKTLLWLATVCGR